MMEMVTTTLIVCVISFIAVYAVSKRKSAQSPRKYRVNNININQGLPLNGM